MTHCRLHLYFFNRSIARKYHAFEDTPLGTRMVFPLESNTGSPSEVAKIVFPFESLTPGEVTVSGVICLSIHTPHCEDPFPSSANRSESLSLHAPPAYSWTWSLPLWFRVLPVHLPVYWHHLPSLSLSAVSGTVKIVPGCSAL